MEMPADLRTLPPEALSILRFFGTQGLDDAFHADDIIQGSGLSPRGFGKGIRRLVTKNYAQMSADQVYRLTETGQNGVGDLQTYDRAAPQEAPKPAARPRFLRRRVVLVTPQRLLAGQPTHVYIGFDDAAEAALLGEPVYLQTRLTVLHGEPEAPVDVPVRLENRAVQQTFEVTAGRFRQIRLRIEVSQLSDDTGQYEYCGGMYVDLPVSAKNPEAALTAYAADVSIQTT
ncbi:MAG: hypothetical protein GYB67_05570 [Chloroflexi bacterium]|nr:hypothetical protein [Chloroflexota bacterium]